MKFLSYFLTIIFALSISVNAQTDVEAEKESIKKVIISAYQDGLGNLGDTEAAAKGFHPGFDIIGVGDNNSLWKYPIYSWIESVEAGKKNGRYPSEHKIRFEFPMIDVTETAAMAKISYYRDDVLTFTDYLLLYKFNEGWRIVSKIFYRYPTDKE